MKIKFFSAFLACAFLSVVTVSVVGCASDKNNSGNQAIVEYSKPVHVSRSVKSQRVYATSANEKRVEKQKGSKCKNSLLIRQNLHFDAFGFY